MIELLYTYIAFKTMRGPRRPVDEAGRAKFHPQHVSFDGHYKNILMIRNDSRQVMLTYWNLSLLLFLEFSQNLRDRARITQAQDG